MNIFLTFFGIYITDQPFPATLNGPILMTLFLNADILSLSHYVYLNDRLLFFAECEQHSFCTFNVNIFLTLFAIYNYNHFLSL